MTVPNLDMPGADASISDLVADLATFDAVPATLAGYLPIREALLAVTPRPTSPGSLLALDPAAVVGHAADVARWRVLNEPFAGTPAILPVTLQALIRPLDAEAKGALKDAGSEVVAQLRVPFDGAAEIMREAVAKGIRPDDDERSLSRASAAVKTAWVACLEAADKLDAILTIRQGLSLVAGVAPARSQWAPTAQAGYDRGQGSGVAWGSVVTRTKGIGVRNPAAPFARWLAVADDLHLVDPAELTDFDVLQLTDAAFANRLAAQ